MDLKTNIEKRLGTTIAGADDKALYYALLGLTKELCSEKKPNEGDRKVYYISAEFLIGKLLSNNLINLGVYEEVKELLPRTASHLPRLRRSSRNHRLETADLADWQPALSILLLHSV